MASAAATSMTGQSDPAVAETAWERFVRSDRTPHPDRRVSVWRARRVDPAQFFSEREVARARAYQRPLRWLSPLEAALAAAVVLAFLFGGDGPKVVESWGVRSWPLQLMSVMVAIDGCLLLFQPVLDGWVDLVHDRRWGLSTRTGWGFLADLVKGTLLSLVLNAVLVLSLYAVIRATPLWWLAGWLIVVALSAVFGFLFPVVVAPLFNRFTPLGPGALADRLAEVTHAAGVPMLGVFVADESRRSRRDNAYVGGLGRTRRVVLFDTLLHQPPDHVAQVVAHELGHWKRRHVLLQLAVLAACTLVVFGLLAGVSHWTWLLHQAGVASVREPGSLPVVLATAGLGFALTGGVNAWVSRAFERQADLDALDLLAQPGDAMAMLRGLHVRNLADLDPGPFRRLTASHPPAAERLALVREWAESKGIALAAPPDR